MQTHGNAAPAPAEAVAHDGLVAALLAGTAAAAAAAIAVFAPDAAHAIADHPVEFVGFLAAAAFLQLRVINVPEQGAVSFASIGMLGAAFSLGPGAGALVAVTAAAVRFVSARGRLDRAIFDAGMLALATVAAEGTFHLAHALDTQPDDRFGPSIFAAAVFYVVNTGMLSVAMGMAEERRPFQVWKERLRWLAPYVLAAGAYAELAVVLYDRIGILGIVALAIAPAALVTPVRRRTFWSS
ncbi:MAG TPA: hypothetical protein VIU16_05980 [Gaiellaceae bacterium]